MDLTPFLATFGLIAAAELGDKTQLTVIALSAGYDRAKVFGGVILAFALVTGLGVLVGLQAFCSWFSGSGSCCQKKASVIVPQER
ncbi:MAG: TMEM165/GDT1 family protein [Candidatus Methanoperedens sp.]|nr:TMEM165/GDT1 family protein [Candidatus Methanoperedens sp.]